MLDYTPIVHGPLKCQDGTAEPRISSGCYDVFMIGSYREFFVASTGASAAFIGLLFVALSFINNENIDEKARAWRRIIASSSFSQLVDVFFVSLIGLLPDPHNLGFAGCVMAIVGLLVSLRLLPKTIDSQKTGRRAPASLGLITVLAYILQLGTSISLLHNPQSQKAYDYLILALILLYAGALARAWEITGIKRR